MADDKSKSPTQPFRESTDFGEAALTKINPQTRVSTEDRVTTISERVPITPSPPQPPEKEK